MDEKKVVVLSKAKVMEKAEFVDVFSSMAALEKYLKKLSPFIKKDPSGDSFHEGVGNNITLYFAYKTTIKD